MATDSALTLSEGGRILKIFDTCNKLFCLVEHEPVGVMVHGKTDFMGIPWETLIKLFRTQMGASSRESLGEYCDAFLRFLGSLCEGAVTEEAQRRYFAEEVGTYFEGLRDRVRKQGQDLTTVSEVEDLLSGAIADECEACQQVPFVTSVAADDHARMKVHHATTLEEARARVFEAIPITAASSEQLNELAVSLFTRTHGLGVPRSGIVVAGFGCADLFPRFRAYRMTGLVAGHLCWGLEAEGDITDTNGAEIAPFAQPGEASMFMEGVHPEYRGFMEESLPKAWHQTLTQIVDVIDGLEATQKTALCQAATAVVDEVLSRYLELLTQLRRARFVDPVLKIVAGMPKDELAALAESLVTLTAVRRRAEAGGETVGGPIDVAVLSKGDGFVWVKRKHYFAPELNPRFIARYYREVEHEPKPGS